MDNLEKKEKNLIELIEKLSVLTSSYSHAKDKKDKIYYEKDELFKEKNKVEKKNEELMREHKYLKEKILKLQKELKDRSDIEDKFNQDIEELSQDTEDLVKEFDKWQM